MYAQQNTGIDPINMGMGMGGNYLTNELRQMRMENMMMRYNTMNQGQAFNPNQKYDQIGGMSPEDSQKIGSMAAALGTSENNRYILPINQPAQILLNNQSIMGAASGFAKGLSQSLQAAPQAVSQQMTPYQEAEIQLKQNKGTNPNAEPLYAKNLHTLNQSIQADHSLQTVQKVVPYIEDGYTAYNKNMELGNNATASNDSLLLASLRRATMMGQGRPVSTDNPTDLSLYEGVGGAALGKIQQFFKSGGMALDTVSRNDIKNALDTIYSGQSAISQNAMKTYYNQADAYNVPRTKLTDYMAPLMVLKTQADKYTQGGQTADKSGFVVGQQYTDGKGNKATYMGNGQWQ